MNVLLIVSGLLLLVVAAEGLIRTSSRLAARLGISATVVGLTVVAYGTSMPELVVSVRSALHGSSGIALGNVVGSNICNIALILGLAAMIRPIPVEQKLLRRELPILVVVSALGVLCLWDGRLSRVDGAIFVAGLIGHLVYSLRSSAGKEDTDPVDLNHKPSGRTWIHVLGILASLGLLALGAQLFVRGAVAAAGGLGVSEAAIGLTIVAVGTSLPELMTSSLAAYRGQSAIAVGNVVGSNLFNILGILGITALTAPIEADGINQADLLMMLALSIVLLPLMRTGFTVNRWEGGVLLAVYIGYVYLQLAG